MRFLRARPVKFLTLLSLLISAVMLTACGASVTYYEASEGGVSYNVYELSIDLDTLEAMENSAALDRDGNKYKVSEYLLELFTDFGYELKEAYSDEAGYRAKYRKAVSGSPELFKLGTAVEFTTTYSENPFVRTIRAQSQNPYNGVREYYDELDDVNGATLIGRLKYGLTVRNEYGEKTVAFPSLYAAFPYVKSVNPDGLKLIYKRSGSSRMLSSGSAKKLNNKTSEYTFMRYFDTTETYIAFEYKRPVPYGWYITAVAAGAIVLTVCVTVINKKRAIGKLIDARIMIGPQTTETVGPHGSEGENNQNA